MLSEVRRTGGASAALGGTWPVLENDGTLLRSTWRGRLVRFGYPTNTDEQSYIALHTDTSLDAATPPLRSTFGDLRPVRMTTKDAVNRTVIFPRAAGDPTADQVQISFARQADGFTSKLGWVKGDLSVGRTYAGGAGKQLDLDQDGKPEITFSQSCGFLV